MKELSLEELKDLQVCMLEDIHQYCTTNNIRYFIGYGTLLGAIRHGGYIPWDDDIDIGMPRPDYDFFIKNFNGNCDNLRVIAPELNWDFFEPYANVYDTRTVLYEDNNPHHGVEIGVKIDIFPLDGVPDDVNEYRTLRKKLYRLNVLRGFKKISLIEHIKEVLLRRQGVRGLIFRLSNSFITYSGVQKRMRKLATQYDWDNSNYVDKITFQNPPETRLPRSVYENYIDVSFEGHNFKSPSDYDSHLRAIYGDYMELPPIEQRVYQHGFKAYWKD